MKRLRPITPGQRGTTLPSFKKVITALKPYKPLSKGKSRQQAGRNSAGRITVRHRGGGHKRKIRAVDFKQQKINIPARVCSVEYDPNRTAFIALVVYEDGERRYIMAPQDLAVGDTLVTADRAEIKPGNRMLLKNIPVGTSVYAIELIPGSGAQLVRSAGSFARVAAHDTVHAHIKLPSREIRKVPLDSWASVGSPSNQEHRLRNYGKAGRRRNLGWRPTVRGSAMGSHDHPRGGGEGRGGRGRRRAVSKWGKPTGIGQKTRRPKRYSNPLIVTGRTKRR